MLDSNGRTSPGRIGEREADALVTYQPKPGWAERWSPVVIQTAKDLWRVNVFEWAATLAFYAVLSLFPLLISLAVLATLFTDAEWAVARVSDLLGQFLPSGQLEVEEIVTAAADDRRRVGFISAMLLLISGRRVLGALTKALNLVSDVDEQDEKVERQALVEIGLLALLGGFFLLALSAGPLLQVARSAVGIFPGSRGPAFEILQVFLSGCLLLGAFFLVYTVVPRGDRLISAAFAGAALATVLFLLARGAFLLVIDRLWSNLTVVYGPMAIAALLLLWAWYVGLIILIGGSFASHVKTMVCGDQQRLATADETPTSPTAS